MTCGHPTLPLLGSMAGGGDCCRLTSAGKRWAAGSSSGRRRSPRGCPRAARKALADASDRRRRAALLFWPWIRTARGQAAATHGADAGSPVGPGAVVRPAPAEPTGQADLLDDALLLSCSRWQRAESAPLTCTQQAKDASKRSKRHLKELEEQRLAGNPASQATAYLRHPGRHHAWPCG